MVGFFKYIGLLINRAAQKSVLLTDRLTILIVPFATLAIWIAGGKMTDTIQETLFLGVAITVMAVVVLRLVAASYFVWKEDRAAIARLEAVIKSPRFKETEGMNEHRLALRKELADCLAWLITFAEARASVRDAIVIYENGEMQYAAKFGRAREIISQLSYDVILRVSCLNLLTLTARIDERGLPDTNDRGRSVSLDRLWEQRKLTFKLLHRQDVDEVISLAQIENLIADHGEGFGDSAVLGLRDLLNEHPELASDPRLAGLRIGQN